MFNKLKAAAGKLRSDRDARTLVFSAAAFAIEIAYSAFDIAVCSIYGSTWYGAAACYQLALAAMRGYVLAVHLRTEKDGERLHARRLKTYTVCGCALAGLTVILSAMVFLIAARAQSFEYSLTVIYIHAGYTFYAIGASAVNFIRSRKQKNFDVRALRGINVAAALISFVSLQSAALTQFSQHLDQTVANAVTGGIICLLILALGTFMAVNGLVKERAERKKQTVDSKQKLL